MGIRASGHTGMLSNSSRLFYDLHCCLLPAEADTSITKSRLDASLGSSSSTSAVHTTDIFQLVHSLWIRSGERGQPGRFIGKILVVVDTISRGDFMRGIHAVFNLRINLLENLFHLLQFQSFSLFKILFLEQVRKSSNFCKKSFILEFSQI